MIKRIFTFSLALILLIGAAPITTVQASSRRNYITDRSSVDGSDYTTSPAMAAELNEIFDGNANIYYDKDCTEPVNTVLGTSPVKNNGYRKYVGSEDTGHVETGTSCYIYANGVYYTLFGESTGGGEPGENSEMLNITGSRRATYENFKAWGVRQGTGALIRASGHSMILLDYDPNYITYLDGNGDGRGLVAINKETWDQFFYSYVSYIIQPKDHLYSDLYASGMCGENLIWSVDEKGTLLLSGTGNLLYPAWSNYNDRIKTVVIGEGVSGIGNGAFYNCKNLQNVIFKGKAPALSESAFLGVTAKVQYPAAKGGWTEAMLQSYGGQLTWEPYGITELKITSQPVCSYAQDSVTVSLTAEGDGLTYTWYTKEAGQSVYVKTSVTGSTYNANLGQAAADRQIMCVVKDQYGNSVQSQSILLRPEEKPA